MTDGWGTFRANVRWEAVRLRRSRRGWLLIIPGIAGPIGSALADLALRVPTDNSPMSLNDILLRIDTRALAVDRVTVQSADLDDVFFALTGHPDIQKGTVQ